MRGFRFNTVRVRVQVRVSGRVRVMERVKVRLMSIIFWSRFYKYHFIFAFHSLGFLGH